MGLTDKRCVPCEGGVPALEPGQVEGLLGQVPGWRVEDGKLRRHYQFEDFVGSMEFVNRMAAVAEGEGHHPDFCVHWNQVDVTIWTHALGGAGLTENDFILAAKLG